MLGEVCYCLHCDMAMRVSEVEDEHCVTPGCDGEGFYWDLYPRRWWRGESDQAELVG
jgi:hypothetical protein